MVLRILIFHTGMDIRQSILCSRDNRPRIEHNHANIVLYILRSIHSQENIVYI